jgi:hypothetical protein
MKTFDVYRDSRTAGGEWLGWVRAETEEEALRLAQGGFDRRIEVENGAPLRRDEMLCVEERAEGDEPDEDDFDEYVDGGAR